MVMRLLKFSMKSSSHTQKRRRNVVAQDRCSPGPAHADRLWSPIRRQECKYIPNLKTYSITKSSLSQTITSAATYGIIPQVHLEGQEFSWVISIFYIGYLIAQYPTNILMQRFPTGRYLAINFTLWGMSLSYALSSLSLRLGGSVKNRPLG